MYSFIFCAVLFAALLLYRLFVRRSSPIHELRIAPAHQQHWLWGHEYAAWSQETNVQHSPHSRWAALLGPVYRIKAPLFSPDVLVTSDNVSAQYIFQHCYRYVKAPEFRLNPERWLGKGIVCAEGEEHKHQRKVLAPALTLASVKRMTDDVILCAENLTARLLKHVLSQGEDACTNISPFVSSCTLDIIGRVAFGHDFRGGQSEDAKSISESWHDDVLLAHTMMTGFCAPLLISKFPWIQKLPIAALRNEGVAKRVAIRIGSQMLRDNATSAGVKTAAEGKDILTILLRNQKTTKESERLPEQVLLENIATFIMVGHETTACTINFALYELAGHPDVQSKLRQKIHELGSDLNYDGISSLPYLDAVTSETLRLHAAASRTDRVALKDDVIPFGNPVTTANGEIITSLPIKAGQVIQIPISVLNTDPQVWGPDSHSFSPERWLTPGGLPPAARLPRGPYTTVASFADGHRNCLGWRLAILEFKAMLTILIRDFAWARTGAKLEEFRSTTTQAFVGEEPMMPLRVRSLGGQV
ncbi:cytochrome P450 [Hymenopellis radicata]|nr:cytochrome P450 [Hymenopellis radicata]